MRRTCSRLARRRRPGVRHLRPFGRAVRRRTTGSRRGRRSRVAQAAAPHHATRSACPWLRGSTARSDRTTSPSTPGLVVALGPAARHRRVGCTNAISLQSRGPRTVVPVRHVGIWAGTGCTCTSQSAAANPEFSRHQLSFETPLEGRPAGAALQCANRSVERRPKQEAVVPPAQRVEWIAGKSVGWMGVL
jgi:hypothetical protein